MTMGQQPRTALVTGSAGFIGYFLTQRLLDDGFRVLGVDSLNDYYDVRLKQRRQAMLLQHRDFDVVNEPIETPGLLHQLMEERSPDVVVHLAAQAGVRYSIDNPRAYLDANITGTYELLEAARATPPKHLLIASTSSVYGANTDMPYREIDKADTQMSFYGATKKATEAMAHAYAHLYALPTTSFRFFTVYGPWGRPDMALFKFTKSILSGQPIDVYNHGDMQRDFTYVTDLVHAIRLLIDVEPNLEQAVDDGYASDSASPVAPYRVVNIGNASPAPLLTFIEAIEEAVGRKAIKTMLPMQPGDVPATWADTTLLEELTGYRPQTKIREGVAEFVKWYRDYYQV